MRAWWATLQWFGRRGACPSAGDEGAGPQSRRVRWSAGCGPVRIVVRAGLPILLEFDRRDNHDAADCVLIPDLGILSTLVPFARSPVHIGPCPPGRFEFRSPDGRLRGSLVVEPAPQAQAAPAGESVAADRLAIGARPLRSALAFNAAGSR